MRSADLSNFLEQEEVDVSDEGEALRWAEAHGFNKDDLNDISADDGSGHTNVY
jgi:hypothetical protein